MDQIVRYADVDNVDDVVKKFATLPVIPVQDERNGSVKFTIPDFPSFVAMLEKITEKFHGEIEVNEHNVSLYEKDAASINKLIKFIKDGARDYVNEFTKELLGIPRGKRKSKGQVQICEAILKSAYDNIHQRTTAFREESRRLKSSIEATAEEGIATSEKRFTNYKVSIPNEFETELEEFIKNRKGTYEKE